jgi:hypothetical protein
LLLGHDRFGCELVNCSMERGAGAAPLCAS